MIERFVEAVQMQTGYIIIFSLITFWLLALSAFFYKFFALFAKLTKNTGGAGLKKILEKILEKQAQNEKDIGKLGKQIVFLEEVGRLHVQKVGLVRFNPFKELGGEHSFALAILDGEDSGVVVTGLHSRDRTRVYMKSVKKGKSDHQLSGEEAKAVAQAQKK